ncbi:MAG: hypothetical protein OXG82_21270 [Gammaproteobacteria bacterium]|nr:hypothetical protein [Gammaproteobacteria bacterium]
MPESSPEAPPPPKAVKLVFEYGSLDALNPHHVDGMQGIVTPSGDLHLMFYSEYMLPTERIETDAPVTETDAAGFSVASGAPDPFMLDPNTNTVRVRRNIECSIVVKANTLRPWPAFLQRKLQEVEARSKGGQ